MPEGRLRDKIALVTGAGAGIGAGIARVLAREGARVFASDVDAVASSQTAEAIRAAGGEAFDLALDVTKGQDITAAFRRIEEEQGRLDVVVNNAGLNVRADFLRQLAGYSATKGAVSALTRALAVEYAPYGIRVNALAPGFIETALTERVLRNPMINKALIDQTPLRRFGSPEDVANVALFLASDEAQFVTGAEIAVDGGMSAAL
jgi:NAD(P)-dependent dehydrogenase (short-subunit alcohol dehydrogenase family)